MSSLAKPTTIVLSDAQRARLYRSDYIAAMLTYHPAPKVRPNVMNGKDYLYTLPRILANIVGATATQTT